MYLLTADEMRRMDRMTIETFGLPGRVLMENAGRGCARVILEDYPGIISKKVAVVAGHGNNGGDGFVIARYLAHAGVRVTVFLLADRVRVKGEALDNLNLLDKLDIRVFEIPDEEAFFRHRSDMAGNDLWVDAILGTGLTGEVRDYLKTVISFINDHAGPVFSVDIPSGLSSERGTPCGTCIEAETTATFAYPKIGHALMPGASYTGKLHVIDIGIPPDIAHSVLPNQFLTRADDIRSLVPPRPAMAHKGTTGHLLVLAGSPGKTGAAAMTAMSAMRCGTGLVTIAAPESINMSIETTACEAMTHPLPDNSNGILTHALFDDIFPLLENKQSIALGPGIGTAETTRELVRRLVQTSPIPVILDADGLNCIAGETELLKKAESDIVLTPHPGEMARLAGITTVAVLADMVGCAVSFAREYGVHVVLKGARTVTALSDGRVYINTTGNPGMASGGMGDVLTGVIAGFIAQRFSLSSALQIAVYLHGASADMLYGKRGTGYLATDVMNHLPDTLKRILDGRFVEPMRVQTPVL